MRIELREDRAVLDGYVNAVGRDSRVLRSHRGKFVEQVEPGTFTKALSRGKPVELRFNHGRAVGSTGDGSLTLREDAIGLRATAVVSDPEVMRQARAGELRGWSFGFHALKDRWEECRDMERRYLEDIELVEVSLLDRTPAYIATTVEEREADEPLLEARSVEDPGEIDRTSVEKDEEKPPRADNTMAELRRRRLKLGGKR